ncbi:monovalent cation/H(+) antiporter subunit G [Gleimia hominis]|uniref:Monovalent cation/H(+) antiporter subunit G n=1 Tax=Gleimia hominis TaxID=595468 RepID=A0ABU3I7Y2_9ACTO|nr:monovalent cation/H(+) antiporter subunit G [Gleimia hominis]MDT3766494.1 monovalent cation/H(+) antiporter subunit G [Gleimia hominis]
MIVLDYIGAVFLLAGATFLLIAGIGLVRLPDVFARMHAASKPQWFGLFLCCLGMVLTMRTVTWVALAVMILLFQTVTAPIGTHIMARAAYRTGQGDLDALVQDDLKVDGTPLGDIYRDAEDDADAEDYAEDDADAENEGATDGKTEKQAGAEEQAGS